MLHSARRCHSRVTQEPTEGYAEPRRAHHARALHDLAVCEFDPRDLRATTLAARAYAFDLGARQYHTTMLLDDGHAVPSDFRRPSHGIATPIHVVASDEGVRGETTLPGRKTVVAPLPREHTDELRVVG